MVTAFVMQIGRDPPARFLLVPDTIQTRLIASVLDVEFAELAWMVKQAVSANPIDLGKRVKTSSALLDSASHARVTVRATMEHVSASKDSGGPTASTSLALDLLSAATVVNACKDIVSVILDGMAQIVPHPLSVHHCQSVPVTQFAEDESEEHATPALAFVNAIPVGLGSTAIPSWLFATVDQSGMIAPSVAHLFVPIAAQPSL